MRWSLVAAVLLSSVASADEWHLFRAKTVFAFAIVQEETDKPVVPSNGKCADCYGTGKRGDGRIIIKCPTCNGTGKVQSGDAAPIVGDAFPVEDVPDAEFVEQIGVVKLLVVVGKPRECIPCENWKRNEMPILRKSGWKEGKDSSDHFEVLTYQELFERHGITDLSIPSFIVTIDGKVQEDSVITGYTAADKLANHVNSYRVGSRQKTGKSIVRVVTTGKRPNGNVIEYFQGFGTGVVIESRSDGFTVLTAAHCVEDAATTKVEVFSSNGITQIPATVVSKDVSADVAILDVKSDSPLPAVEVDESDLVPGTLLHAWGCDDGGDPQFRQTIVDETFVTDGVPWIWTRGDADKGIEADPVHGRSGGGLFLKGKLVAMYSAAQREKKRGLCVRVSAMNRLKGIR
jgi:hypothetical protein